MSIAPASRRRRVSASPWQLVAGTATGLAAILTLASSLSPNLPGREQLLEAFEPGAARVVAHGIGVLGGLALLSLSWGVVRGRRRAGQAACAVLCVLVAVHLAKGLDYEEAAIALSLAALLRIGLGAAARGAAPPRGLVAGLGVVAATTGAYAAVVSTLLLGGHPPELGDALSRAATAVAQGGVTPHLHGTVASCVHVLVGLALVAAVAGARAVLAPARAWEGHEHEQHERAARIVAEHGADSLSPFLLRADKAYFFAHGGVLAYRTLRETAVVSGDPVGPPEVGPAIVADFLDFAAGRGWDVVATAAGPGQLPAYRKLGLRAIQIGSEAVLDPRSFSLEGRAIRKVRQSVHRVARRGWTVEVVEARRLTPALAAEIDAVEGAWRATRRRLTGFAMAMDRLWGAPEDAHDVYVLGREPQGSLRAFLRFVSYRDGLSLDAMRRRGDEPNGLNEALVVAALEHAADRGLREVSLNFAGFAHVMAADALLSGGQRVLRWCLRCVHGRFQLERLVRFNEKFRPQWRPRYLLYTRHTRFPLAALRVLQAEAYVRAPRGRRLRTAWRPGAQPGAGSLTAVETAR